MDKSKIVKIVAAAVVVVFAIIYYAFGNKEDTSYENILVSNVVVENQAQESETEEKQKIKVYVTGEVNSPGVVELEEGARIQDAIDAVGGIKAEANLQDVNLAYEISDGEKIYIPNLSDATGETEQDSQTTSASSGSGSNTSSNSNSKININKATASELTSVPGIGESTAQKIIDYRDQNGKFKSIEDIKNVSGIGDSKYEKMKDYISVK